MGLIKKDCSIKSSPVTFNLSLEINLTYFIILREAKESLERIITW